MTRPIQTPSILVAFALVAAPVNAQIPERYGQSSSTTGASTTQSNSLGSAAATGAFSDIAYADLVDLVLAAPLIADATIRSTSRISAEESPNLSAGKARLYVEVDVTSLIRGVDGLPPRIGYLLDVATDARSRLPKLKKARVLIFAKRVASAAGQVQLVGSDAQRDWTPALDARARQVVKDVVAADAPPVITDVGNAFHVAGALPGEGETQIFLTTADQRPVSLSVLRRPGEQPRWAVALSEIVDEAAAPPARDTLLWYRLACALPPALPDHSIASPEAADAAIAREDYRFVVGALGTCGRERSR